MSQGLRSPEADTLDKMSRFDVLQALKEILEAGTPLELWRETESNAAAFHAAAAALPLLEVTEEVYENQRKPVLGSAFSSQHLVKVERPAWSDEKGRPRVKRSVQLPRGWSWLDDEWVVDMRGESIDADG